ncbi:MAG: cysteine-rich VLP domain-containing protein [Oscillospiraceae bacterium]|nr:cysteine-rich VLP domain-containing protein [Oscillospiraceae bacterium]
MTWSITPQQVELVQRLARSDCCNCVDGNCLLLDDGEEQTCVQLICIHGIYCRYFREAVLPADEELYAAIVRQNEEK